MSTQDLAIVKERIAKLLAMAADTASPNEAAIAAERARKLMDKYQIDTLDVTAKVDGKFATVKAWETPTDYVPPWMATLAVTIAQYNDCQARYQGGYFTKGQRQVWGKTVIFSGFADDAALAAAMYKYIHDTIQKLTKEWFKSRGEKRNHRLARNFGIGAVHEIARRIDSMARERDQVMSTGTSLVLVKAKAVEEEFGAMEYRTKKATALRDAGYAATAAGMAKGRTMAIHPEVGNE